MKNCLQHFLTAIFCLVLVLAVVCRGSAIADDARPAGEPPIPDKVHLEPINPKQLWQAISPALAEGRRPELVEQLVAVFTDPNPAQSPSGWYHESETRYGWDWLRKRFDANQDGVISPGEFNAPRRAQAWSSLDRNRDRRLAPDDFDWSQKSTYVRQSRQALKRFDELDADANGRLSLEEWQQLYTRLARGKNYLSVEDFRSSLIWPRGPTRHASSAFRFDTAGTGPSRCSTATSARCSKVRG